MAYKNMKKQKAHIKSLRKNERKNNELTERDYKEIENTIPITHDND